MRLFLSFLLGAAALHGQTPTAPVRYTVAKTQTFQSEVRLPGTVESRKSSAVATEIEGLVEMATHRLVRQVAGAHDVRDRTTVIAAGLAGLGEVYLEETPVSAAHHDKGVHSLDDARPLV